MLPLPLPVESCPATALQVATALAQFSAELLTCDDCGARGEVLRTPDPCYGSTPNAEAGWIGYYAVQCTNCGLPFPGDRFAAGERAEDPVTLSEHRAAMQSAVNEWNR